MEESYDNLFDSFSLKPREHIALVGGGGKTSLMLSLSNELAEAGKRVVATTTTKVSVEEAESFQNPIYIQSNSFWKDSLKKEIEGKNRSFLAHHQISQEKVAGIEPSLADRVYQTAGVDYLIVEADGAARHPVKVPDKHEPIIPQSATIVIAVMGLEALNRPVDPDTIFRLELFEKITGLNRGESFDLVSLLKIFTAPSGLFKGTPSKVKRIVLLNKLDIGPEAGTVRELAGLIAGNGIVEIDRVIFGSLKRGQFFRLNI